MTDTNNQPASNSKAPSHLAYQVREGQEGKSFWNLVGSVWQHGDGKGFTLRLDSLPLDGRITVREYSERK